MKIRTSKKPMIPKVVELTLLQTTALDTFVRSKYQELGKKFCDGFVAADATLAGVLDVFDNFIVPSSLISDSRKRLGIDIPKDNAFVFRHRKTTKKIRIAKNPKTKKMSIVGL